MVAHRMRIRGIAMICLLLGGASCLTREPGFSPEAWISCTRETHWSRQVLMESFCSTRELQGEAREQMLAWLGPPDLSTELDPGNEYRHRIELYRVNSENTTRFRIDYDGQDRVTGYAQEAGSCESGISGGPGESVLTIADLRTRLLDSHTRAQIYSMTEEQLFALIGRPDRTRDDSARWGMTWLLRTHAWRMSSDGRDTLGVTFKAGAGERIYRMEAISIESVGLQAAAQPPP